MVKEFTNKEIAKILKAVAAAYEVKKGDKFKIMAYDRASTSVEHATSEIKDLWDDGKLNQLPGIGASIASHLDELFRTGRVRHFEEVMKGLPPAMFELLSIPGIGAKTAYKLCQKLKIKNPKTALKELEKAAKLGKIRVIEGFGEDSERKIKEAIEAFKKGQIKERRMVLPYADAIAQEIVSYLLNCRKVKRIDTLGSLKRMVSTIGDIDIAVATESPQEVIDWFLKYPKIKKVIEKGPTGASILLENGRQVDLRIGKPRAYGAMLQYFIGSKHHNIHLRELALKKGFSLSEYGIRPLKFKKDKQKILEFEKEEDFYHFLGLDWIPPELREDSGEIEAALNHTLPNLVKIEDIKGDLHIHSDFPIETSHDQGTTSMEEIIRKGEELGYEYIGFAEHNPSVSRHKPEEIIEILKRKKEKIDKINYSNEKRVNNMIIRALNGLEIDIKPNGMLGIPEKGLKLLDYAIVSVHTSFKMNREEMTKRILSALEHPKIKILGHPTGRKLNEREGYELDWEKVFDFCLKKGKWLEINAWPDRLDLPDVLVREAVKRKVKMVICTDSHSLEHLNLMRYGVAVARRGWAEKNDIINTLPYKEFKKLLNLG
jgi:DNA polymerase (family 10)